jgi:hypothetical protein
MFHQYSTHLFDNEMGFSFPLLSFLEKKEGVDKIKTLKKGLLNTIVG